MSEPAQEKPPSLFRFATVMICLIAWLWVVYKVIYPFITQLSH